MSSDISADIDNAARCLAVAKCALAEGGDEAVLTSARELEQWLTALRQTNEETSRRLALTREQVRVLKDIITSALELIECDLDAGHEIAVAHMGKKVARFIVKQKQTELVISEDAARAFGPSGYVSDEKRV